MRKTLLLCSGLALAIGLVSVPLMADEPYQAYVIVNGPNGNLFPQPGPTAFTTAGFNPYGMGSPPPISTLPSAAVVTLTCQGSTSVKATLPTSGSTSNLGTAGLLSGKVSSNLKGLDGASATIGGGVVTITITQSTGNYSSPPICGSNPFQFTYGIYTNDVAHRVIATSPVGPYSSATPATYILITLK
ncbi:MAG: hypothetical protein ACOYKZ_02755 [Chlamydiia bacterium]